jgi:sarcosine oxidase subunit beta
MSDRADVAIIGGGIAGLALAYELARLAPSMRIVVLEQRFTGGGASSRNVGRIRAMQLTPDLVELALAAQRKHERLSDELRSNTLFWRAGYAWVLYDGLEVERMRALLPMFKAAGLRAPRVIDGHRVAGVLPILRGGEVPAGAMIGHDAVGHHDAVLYAYRRACVRAAVDVREHTRVSGILREGEHVTGVMTEHGDVGAPIVVNATDGWSREVSAMVGLEVPNTPVRREVFVTEPTQPFMRPAVTFYRPVEGWFNQTLRGELVAGVTAADEPAGLRHGSSFGFLTRTSRTLMRKAPRLGHLRIIRQWAGVYDMTPDRLPIVGHEPERPGFVQFNGTSGRGFALAPVLAEMLASWLVTGERPDRLAALEPGRFAGHRSGDVLSTDYYAGYHGTQST